MSQVFKPGPPSLANDDSMLSRRFGKEVINYYGGGLLNRFSFLRNDIKFIRQAATTPAARFVALRDLNPLVADAKRLAFFGLDDVKPLIGADPFGRSDEDKKAGFDSTKPSPLLLFLGLQPDVPQAVDFETSKHGVVNGQPYFALDVTPQEGFTEATEAFVKSAEAKGYSVQTNVRTMTMDPEEGESLEVLILRSHLIRHSHSHPFSHPHFSPLMPLQLFRSKRQL